jgi:hydrogenase nickel incorporation protein HypA/HybF
MIQETRFKVHELSLADSIINTAIDVATQHQATEIKKITVDIGSFALVIKEQLHFCLNILADKTIASQAAFELLEQPGELKCEECGFRGKIDMSEDNDASFGMNLFSCPKCKSLSTTILSGRDVIVRSVDLAFDPTE